MGIFIWLLVSMLVSFAFWSPGCIELRVGRGRLSPNDVPGWMRSLYEDSIARATSANWSGTSAYAAIAVGTVLFGVVVTSGIWRWYRYGFNRDVVGVFLALSVWLAIIYWHSKLGR